MNGAGPNIAQQQLQAGTDANIKNAMAMGQSMPGGGASPMAAYRGILDNQAQAQQQGAGQAAQLRAQQQLAAQGQLGGLLGGARGQDLGLGEAQAQLGMGIRGQNMQGQIADQQHQVQMAQLAQNQAQFNAQNDPFNRILGGLIGAGGAALGGLTGGLFKGGGDAANSGSAGAGGGAFLTTGGIPLAQNMMPQSSPGDYYPMTGGAAQFAAGGGMISGAIPSSYLGGGPVPGQAPVPGNSLRNDTVPAMLSPGEIVLPRTVVNDEDAEEKAAQFVAAIKARRRAA